MNLWSRIFGAKISRSTEPRAAVQQAGGGLAIETAQQIESRLATAMREMELWRDYRYTIVSGSVEQDLENVRSIMSAEMFLSRRLTLNR